MAITSIGSLCSGSNKSSGTTQLSLTPGRNVAAGRLLVAYIAWDSVFSVFQPNDGEFSVYVTDSADNHWCNIGAGTDQQAFFNSGAIVILAATQLRNALTTSDTITANGFFLGTLIAKAMSIEEFDLGTGMRWCRSGVEWSTVITNNADPGSVTHTPNRTREWLYVHALGNEGPSTDSFTWDADYTEITSAGTTGGGDDSNITILGGYRITTLSSDTVDVTNDTSSTRDCTQTMCAITAIEPTPDFPTTPILDDFNRANEFPMDGGLWNTTDTAFGSAQLTLDSNQARGGGGSFFDQFMEACVEVYATFSDVSGWANLHVHAGGNASLANMVGEGSAAWEVSIFGNTGLDAIVFSNSSGNQGAPVSGSLWAFILAVDGHKWGIQRTLDPQFSTDYVNHLWVDVGSGWEEVAALYHVAPTFNDGNLALGILDSGGRVDDFGGGQTLCFFRGIVSMNHRSATRHKAASRALVNPSDV